MSTAEYELLLGWDAIITVSQPQQQQQNPEYKQYCEPNSASGQHQPQHALTDNNSTSDSTHRNNHNNNDYATHDNSERALYTTNTSLSSVLLSDDPTSALHASTLQHLPLPSDLAPYSAATVEAATAAARPRGAFAPGPRFPAMAASPVLVANAALTDLVLRRALGTIATGPLLHPAPLVGNAPATTWEAPGMQYLKRCTVAQVFHSAAADALAALVACPSPAASASATAQAQAQA